jgi:DNA primase
LDFKAVRERASFLGVLDRYHVQLKKVAANQYKANCPLPSHSNATESGTFGVNIDRNIFKCFSDSCRKAGNGSQGNVIDFVAAMEGVQAYDAAGNEKAAPIVERLKAAGQKVLKVRLLE